MRVKPNNQQARFTELGAQVEPDILTAQQFFDRRRQAMLTGEKQLMLAVLEEAVGVLQKYGQRRDGLAKHVVREAREWIESQSRGYVFTFETICEALALDADWLRAGILRMLERDPVPSASRPDTSDCPRPWTAHRFCALRHRLGLTQMTMAPRLGVCRQVVAQWELQITPIAMVHWGLLDALEQGLDQLAAEATSA